MVSSNWKELHVHAQGTTVCIKLQELTIVNQKVTLQHECHKRSFVSVVLLLVSISNL